MNTPATHSLAVCGWTPDSADALAALVEGGRYRAMGVADSSGAALVQARRDTGLPCFQQVRQFLASADYHTVLIASAPAAALAHLAAARGADLLVLASTCDAEALEAVAEAARAHGARLTLLRPEAHDAGLGDLARLLASSPGWRPGLLDITVEGATDLDRLLGIAIAHATRFAHNRDGLVQARTWVPREGALARAVDVALEAGDARINLRVRHAPEPFLRIVGEAPAGAFELRLTDEGATFTYTTAAGDHVQYRPEPVDHWAVEVARAASADDSDVVREQAGLLGAVTRSILTGDEQATDCCSRPELRLIAGRGSNQTRRGNLRLVVSHA